MKNKMFIRLFLLLAIVLFATIDLSLVCLKPEIEPIGLIIWIIFQPAFIVATILLFRSNNNLCQKIIFDNDLVKFEYDDKSIQKKIADCREIEVLSNRYRFSFKDGSNIVYATKLSPFKKNEDIDFSKFFNAKVY